MKFLYRLFVQIILSVSNDAKIALWDRVRYILDVVIHIIPIAILGRMANIWFEDNKQFAAALFWCLFVNLAVGIYRHLKCKTFNWADMFGKNGIVVFSAVVTYISLEFLIIVLGDIPSVQYFEAVLQAATLMFPISKILKNIFIISNGQYPPKWLMEKVYNFEKTGDLEKLFKNDEK